MLSMAFSVFNRNSVSIEDGGDCSNVYKSNEVNEGVIFGKPDKD